MTQQVFQQHLPVEESYRPVFGRTDAMESHLRIIERDRWAFDNLIIDEDYRNWFQERAIIRSVHSSTSIEGNRLAETEAAIILRGEEVEAEEVQKREIINLKKALDFVDSVSSDPDIPIDESTIREINRIILSGESDLLTPGQYRQGQSLVRNPMTRQIAYTPPNAGDVPAVMRQFGLWLRQTHDSVEAPLIAAIAHLRLVEIHPFWDGNGRTARALTTLVLQRYGYTFNRMLSPERQFAWSLKDYFGKIGETVGTEYIDDRNLTVWIEFFLSTLCVEVITVSASLVDFRRFMQYLRIKFRPMGLTKRQVDVLAYAQIHRSLSVREYRSVFGGSRETARRDFNALLQLGALRAVGQTRSRRYETVDWEELKNLIEPPPQRVMQLDQ